MQGNQRRYTPRRKSMKRLTGAMVLAGLVLLVGGAAGAEEAKSKGGYVHVVIFTMKKDAPAKAIDEAAADCHKMLAKISHVRLVKVGKPADKATPRFAKKDYDLALLVLVDDFDGL